MNDVVFPATNVVSYHTFSLGFQSCELLFDTSHYFDIGSTSEAYYKFCESMMNEDTHAQHI